MTFLNLVTIFLALWVHPVSIHVTVQDESGAALPDALVIVESLDNRLQTVRYLSGKDGNTPTMELKPGLYRVIVTYPYGPWQTVIREFSLPDGADEVTVRIPGRPSDEYGEIVGAPQVKLIVESQDHNPLSGVPVLIRTKDAIREAWYETDKTGGTTISVVASHLVAVVLYEHKAYSYQLSSTCPPPNPSFVDTDLPCVVLTDGPLTLHLPKEHD